MVTDDEGKRLKEILTGACDETTDVSAALIVASDEGYESVSTIYVTPDAGFLDHHVLY